MAEQQSGLDEAVQVGTSAVSHIRSLRTFSLFAKSAKGAAVAGPLGAALGLAIANRHTILKNPDSGSSFYSYASRSDLRFLNR